MSRIYISKLNPVKLVWENRVLLPQYNEPNFDDMLFEETIRPWEELIGYDQKWQTSDTIVQQYTSSFNSIEITLYDEYDNLVHSSPMAKKQQNIYNPGFYIYESHISLASIPEGNYRMRVFLGTEGDSLLSEPMCIKERHEGTKYIEYAHSRYKHDIIFNTGIVFNIRVEMERGKLKPGSRDTMWEDQPLNQTIIDSKNYRVWPYYFGGSFGIPDWLLDKLSLIFGLDSTQVDGMFMTKAESNQEFEEKSYDDYPLRGFIYPLREAYNRSSKVYDPNVNTNRKLVLIGNIDTKLFGDISNNAESNQVPILEFE